jgi:hypothetical protein
MSMSIFNDFARFAVNWQVGGTGLDGDFDNSGGVDANDLWHFTGYWLEDIIFPPIAEDQNVSLTQGHSIEIILDANDENGDPLNYYIMDYPLQGKLILDGNSATYQPTSS